MQKVQYMPREGTNLDILCKYLNIARRNPVPFLGPALRWSEQDEAGEKSPKSDILAVTIKDPHTGAGPNNPANPCPFCSRRE